MADRVTVEPIAGFQGEYRWLSNFEPVDIAFEGILYPSVEHAYVAAKTTDHKLRLSIAQMATPGRAKRAGRTLLLRPDWDQVKLSVMEALLRLKFTNVRLRRLLLSSRPRMLIEGNTWGDQFWGMTWESGAIPGWTGENHLGKLLMKIRDEFPTDDAGVLLP